MQASPPDPKNPQRSRAPVPEMIGATNAAFALGKGTTTASFQVHAPTGPAASLADGQTRRVLLRVENVKSNNLAPTFDVYLNVPPGDTPDRHPDLFAFTLSTFGLVESSKSRGQHPGNGLNFVHDVTELYLRLTAARTWDGRTLRLSFVPAGWKGSINVEVGRVSLMME